MTTQSSAEELGRIFYEAVQYGSSGYYTQEQRDAWAPDLPELSGWQARLAEQKVWVAKRDGALLGFISLTSGGHIDFLFVLPDYMGQGISDLLYDRLVEYACAQGITTLTSDASYLARSFFLKKGWQEIRKQEVTLRGTVLTNFKMEIRLGSP